LHDLQKSSQQASQLGEINQAETNGIDFNLNADEASSDGGQTTRAAS
jgi:hypothetical protein